VSQLSCHHGHYGLGCRLCQAGLLLQSPVVNKSYQDLMNQPAASLIRPPAPEQPKAAPTDSERRKRTPIYSGVLKYFPRTMVAMARLSWAGNEKHNPGQPLHWSRSKSADHKDCAVRHLMTDEELDTETNELHAVAAAWRACANCELVLEKKEGGK
jgi:hypothetical protein